MVRRRQRGSRPNPPLWPGVTEPYPKKRRRRLFPIKLRPIDARDVAGVKLLDSLQDMGCAREIGLLQRLAQEARTQAPPRGLCDRRETEVPRLGLNAREHTAERTEEAEARRVRLQPRGKRRKGPPRGELVRGEPHAI